MSTVDNVSTECIVNHKIGYEDISGNKIVNIISRRDWFVIYEIESKSLPNRIRVIIDSSDKELEKKIVDKFNHVKSKYIKAKATLLHPDTYEENKNQIGHTLSTYLDHYEDKDDDGRDFEKIIEDIFEKIIKFSNTS